MTDKVDYKFNEGALIEEFAKYVDGTYSEHYAKDKVQAMDLIIAAGHGKGFCVGDIIKYATRYGTKKGHNRADILKILHYALFLLHIHDKQYSEPQTANIPLFTYPEVNSFFSVSNNWNSSMLPTDFTNIKAGDVLYRGADSVGIDDLGRQYLK